MKLPELEGYYRNKYYCTKRRPPQTSRTREKNLLTENHNFGPSDENNINRIYSVQKIKINKQANNPSMVDIISPYNIKTLQSEAVTSQKNSELKFITDR